MQIDWLINAEYQKLCGKGGLLQKFLLSFLCPATMQNDIFQAAHWVKQCCHEANFMYKDEVPSLSRRDFAKVHCFKLAPKSIKGDQLKLC